ncbi:hypothetical protein [uncultured Pontibacter sp.]|uniref:hypothetical protein n=1 Tax=uncultured Pontibacter sp. TaxID=453356 RepID=UPI0026393362|nr:hypothetical protein [uncultured Pontibacter sp.]
MRLHIDKANLINIFREDEHYLQKDVIKTMKLNLDVQFNFSKQEIGADEFLSMQMLQFTEGIGEDVDHFYEEENYVPYLIDSDVHKSHPNKQSLFLLDNPAEVIQECKLNGGLLIQGLGEEFDLFEKLFLFRKDAGFHKGLKIGSDHLKSWPCLSPYALPFTDLILIDNYIANDSSILDSNLIDLLKNLHLNKSIETNIVIFTDKTKQAISIDNLRSKIIKAIKKVTGKCPKVTIVLWKESKDRKHIDYGNQYTEHDRTILLNYVRFKSGDSFNYFNSSGVKITLGRELDIFSLANRDNFILAKDIINDLNKYIAWAKEKNSENIQGDKKSNFLKF